ncbi:calpain-like cysteine peptidase, partial [Trypanosoma conorhini]
AALVSDIRELKKDRRKNADAIEGIVRAMNGRADALAAAQLDRGFLDPEPAGVPLEILSLDADDAFHAAETERARLKLSDPRRNAGKIKELEDDMNARAHVLAGELKEKEREIFLDPQPGGVPVSELPLDSDESFHTMEVERLRLRNEDPRGNAAKIKDLEGQLNERALDVARAVKEEDLEALESAPRGIPLALLRPHDDEAFASLAKEARGAGRKSGGPSPHAAADALNERARELADQVLRGDRGFLDREPEGVPLSMLPLDTDRGFHEMEVERAVLKLTDPKKNADKIAALEDRLTDRAHELAHERLSGDRGFLNPGPEGVPLEILPLDEDPKFHQMEAERAKLKAQDPRRNERKVADLENAMNDRCHELACDQLREDLAGVDKEPRDIPLELLHPHGDPAFAALVSDIRELKKDRRKNADAIEGIVRAMNGRADALAAAQLDRGFLDPEPAGVPLEILSLDADDAFHAA